MAGIPSSTAPSLSTTNSSSPCTTQVEETTTTASATSHTKAADMCPPPSPSPIGSESTSVHAQVQVQQSPPPVYPKDGGGELPNFGRVAPGITRSAFPPQHCHKYLKSLGVQTVVTLVPTKDKNRESMAALCTYVEENGDVEHVRIPMSKSYDAEYAANVYHAIDVLIQQQQLGRPLHIHCNQGRHRTGVVIACYRRLDGWDAEQCIAEYLSFANGRERDGDIKFIREFDPFAYQERSIKLAAARLNPEGGKLPEMDLIMRDQACNGTSQTAALSR